MVNTDTIEGELHTDSVVICYICLLHLLDEDNSW